MATGETKLWMWIGIILIVGGLIAGAVCWYLSAWVGVLVSSLAFAMGFLFLGLALYRYLTREERHAYEKKYPPGWFEKSKEDFWRKVHKLSQAEEEEREARQANERQTEEYVSTGG